MDRETILEVMLNVMEIGQEYSRCTKPHFQNEYGSLKVVWDLKDSSFLIEGKREILCRRVLHMPCGFNQTDKAKELLGVGGLTFLFFFCEMFKRKKNSGCYIWMGCRFESGSATLHHCISGQSRKPN